MSYGHGISVSLLQLARAYMAFATRGEIRPVTLLKTEGESEGERVISERTARAVTSMLEMAVQPGGTAPKAQVPGYRVAGKTGTAHKQVNGRYAPNIYVSSFVGFAPVSAPRFVIAVMIDEPSAGQYYGGAIAAPVFSKVMGGALRSQGVVPDAPPKEWSDPVFSAPEIKGRGVSVTFLQQLEQLGARVTRLTADSRKVAPGVAFAAYPGERQDGRAFIPHAIERGGNAVLWERANFKWQPDWRIANIGVDQLRDHVGDIASAVYGHPSEKLWMLGVTGTNGKTSVSHWLAQCLAAHGKSTAVLGTLGNGFLNALEPAVNTTPDAIELQEKLAAYCERGAESVAMEVSSHGLAQGRVNGVLFDVALFTNLSRDHLDYHGDMESYGAAKAKLFEMPGLHYGVINLDDEFGRVLATRLEKNNVPMIGYTIADAHRSGASILRASKLQFSGDGLRFDVRSPWGSTTVQAPVFGRFNAYNVLAVMGGLIASDVSLEMAARLVAGIRAVQGRMQRLGGSQQPLVLIDYAHTPDALEKTLTAARELTTTGKLICVFGCGGNRDTGKRPVMGEIAQRLADQVVLTSDNPRDEDPQTILADIRAGMTRDCDVIPDRAKAIAQSIRQAGASDVILIAGKGPRELSRNSRCQNAV